MHKIGHPLLALIGAFVGGALAGLITGVLHTKLRIQAILAGSRELASYSINLRIMEKRLTFLSQKVKLYIRLLTRCFRLNMRV